MKMRLLKHFLGAGIKVGLYEKKMRITEIKKKSLAAPPLPVNLRFEPLASDPAIPPDGRLPSR